MAVAFADVQYGDPATYQRAFRAVRRMNEIQPMFQGIARAMTGIPTIKIAITNGTPQTDGKTIWLRPPIELGDVITHDRVNCSRRDEKSRPVCPACAQWEKVIETLFHEMAHIIEKTFDEVDLLDRADLFKRIINENPGMPGSRLAKLQTKFDYEWGRGLGYVNYMGMASSISPFLPIIINALEDARVNRAMAAARAGTYHMFRSKLYNVFENGIEGLDGVTFRWNTADENGQAVIGVLCKACGVEPREGYLSESVLAAMSDPALSSYIASLANVEATAADTYRASFIVLEHLRRLGFCRRPDDLEDDQPPEPQPQDQQPEPQEGESDEESGDASVPGKSEDSGSRSSESPSEESDDSSDDVQEPGDDSDDASSSESDGESGDNDERDDDGSQSSDNDTGSESDTVSDADDDTDEAGESETEDTSQSRGQSSTGSDERSDDGEADDEDGSAEPSGSTGQDGTSDDTEETENEHTGSVSLDEVDEEAADERMNASDPDEVARLVKIFGGHDTPGPVDNESKRELGVAIIQAEQFDEPSGTVSKVNVHKFDQPTERSMMLSWACQDRHADEDDACDATPDDYAMPESLLGATLLKMRTIFADNKKSKRAGELRSGRVNSNRLPSVMAGNTKVFTRNLKPGQRDYFVCLGLDVSGSTYGPGLDNIKLMGMAIGNLLSRSGVKFAIYAHTGASVRDNTGNWSRLYEADVFVIKEEHDMWDDRAKSRLAVLNASGNNLDGHALEFFRKRCDQSTATDKVILYVTDGAMPEANRDDETEVLKREIKECAHRRYSLVGVGISTNSPKRHGLDTVRIDEPRDISLLIQELGKRLAVKR